MPSMLTKPLTMDHKPVHALTAEQVLALMQSSARGLDTDQVTRRRQQFGANSLPRERLTGFFLIFLRQFKDPLIYILVFAAVLSLAIGELTDAAFICAVLLVNAMIGAAQEHSAQRSASSLTELLTTLARVQREGESYELDATELVPGDIVTLESGNKVPADMRLLNAQNLLVDESLLSGESLPEKKQADVLLPENTLVADRVNVVFSGTLILRGRAIGVVVATGLQTQLGQIAQDVMQGQRVKPPLLLRMEKFTMRLAMLMIVVTVLLGLVLLYQGAHWVEVFMLAAALAVAVTPEGLPVALTVALAISIRRMAKRHVIARRLVTVEALGSCTYIASDKTGTLTRNELAVQAVVLPQQAPLHLPVTDLLPPENQYELLDRLSEQERDKLLPLVRALVLANEGFLGMREGQWVRHGDTMDLALLVLGHNLKLVRSQLLSEYPLVDTIPYESSARFAASVHQHAGRHEVFVKGAVETVLDFCNHMLINGDTGSVDRSHILQQARELAARGYRVLAAAQGDLNEASAQLLHISHLKDLKFLGLVGVIDPLREESQRAVQQCRQAGVEVAMVTGDHPITAYAIAKELGLVTSEQQVVNSPGFYDSEGMPRSNLIRQARVFARMEPHQKLELVGELQKQGHFVAVTGDGANDAPALRAAHVGVAMGKSGTDVARETADIILTDDNFASIVAGIEEGRIAYGNVRKVIFLLLSTGAGEIVLFLLSLLLGLPIPLTAVQLLWLNLVTNGLQDVALAFEPGEGEELQKPPRDPREPIFNRIMVERVLVSALVMGSVACAAFYSMLQQGMSVEEARNGTLLLMVLFENIHVFNCRSETAYALSQNPLRNRFLLSATVAAQAIHILAMYTPGLSDILDVAPVSLLQWLELLAMALSLLLASELYKWAWRRRRS